MFNFLLLPLLIAVYATVCHANVSANGFTGGYITKVEKHPYFVTLQLKNGTHICGGALYNKDTIITSGQCLLYYSPFDVYVRVGTNNYASGGELIPISSYIINSKFKFTNMHRDIAVVKLTKRVKYTRKVDRIHLGTKEPKTGRYSMVTSWNTKKRLVDVKVKTIRWKDCGSGRYIFKKNQINNKMICAAPTTKKTCNGEAGSPLVYKHKLIGLVSWAYTCANKGNPYVYTNVVKMRKWIKTTEKKMSLHEAKITSAKKKK